MSTSDIPSTGVSGTPSAGSKCPFTHGTTTLGRGTQNKDWWPEILNLDILRQRDEWPQTSYQELVKSLDLPALKDDIKQMLRTSQDWWPSEYGHYGGLFVRFAWHNAGTYRTTDGRGGGRLGASRFAPLNSWPDNTNLDKARRLLWPIKQKYGSSISWADLSLLVGTVAIEDMGGPSCGFALGRADIYQAPQDIFWGNEKTWLAPRKIDGEDEGLSASHMGLIYVNPQGPDGVPDPLGSAVHIRFTFGRMGMNDVETVALTVGGHTFGKSHGAGGSKVGPAPAGTDISEQGLGWINLEGTGNGKDTHTSGIEGAWTSNPIQWDHEYLRLLLDNEWELGKSPSGAHQWHLKDSNLCATQVDGTQDRIIMTTADMALREDPEFLEICQNFRDNPEQLDKAFAEAWFKLLHRDMGPPTAYVAGDYGQEEFEWQDAVPPSTIMSQAKEEAVRAALAQTGLEAEVMVETAWAAASNFRQTDRKGGANGFFMAFEPQSSWEANKPDQLTQVIQVYRPLAAKHEVSVADVIVLGGSVGLHMIAGIQVPASTGRSDSSKPMNAQIARCLEPRYDGFRNYMESGLTIHQEEMLLDRAHLLGLTPSELVVLLSGLRSMGITHSSNVGIFHTRELSNRWLQTLLSMEVRWEAAGNQTFRGICRKTGEVLRTASRADLIIGSHAELRAIAEFYAQSDMNSRYVGDFVAAWTKVMNNDRFDLDNQNVVIGRKTISRPENSSHVRYLRESIQRIKRISASLNGSLT